MLSEKNRSPYSHNFLFWYENFAPPSQEAINLPVPFQLRLATGVFAFFLGFVKFQERLYFSFPSYLQNIKTSYFLDRTKRTA
jgi:hypothetical protein